MARAALLQEPVDAGASDQDVEAVIRKVLLQRACAEASLEIPATEQTLSGSLGPVLDPIFSIRKRVQLAPGATP